MTRMFFFLVLLISSSFSAFATSINPTGTPFYFTLQTYSYPSTAHFSTAAAACADEVAIYASHSVSVSYPTCPVNGGDTINNYGQHSNMNGSLAGVSCPSGYTLNNSTGLCDTPACPSGAVSSSGFYDLGTDPNSPTAGATVAGAPPLITCAGGCGQQYTGSSIGYRALVQGVYHYYAQGSYAGTGNSCTSGSSPGTTAPPSVSASVPSGTCAAGQIMGTVTILGQNGFNINRQTCSNATTGAVINPNSGVPTTQTIAQQIAGAQLAASGTGATVTLNVPADGSGGSGNNNSPPVSGLSKDDPLQSACAKNPNLDICKQSQPSGTVGTAAIAGYTKQTRSIADSYNGFKSALQAAPIVAASSGFFTLSISGGSCVNWSGNIPMLGTVSFTQFCTAPFTDFLPYLRAMVMIIFAIVAFRIAIL